MKKKALPFDVNYENNFLVGGFALPLCSCRKAVDRPDCRSVLQMPTRLSRFSRRSNFGWQKTRHPKKRQRQCRDKDNIKFTMVKSLSIQKSLRQKTSKMLPNSWFLRFPKISGSFRSLLAAKVIQRPKQRTPGM